MPVVSLDRLLEGDPLLDLADRIVPAAPGVVLTTGQSRSGKVTMLVALAERLASASAAVTLMSELASDFHYLQPLPPGWRVQQVEPGPSNWSAALATLPASELPLVAGLSEANAPEVYEVAARRRVLAAVDTPLIGLDVAYTLRGMGVGYASFVRNTSCVWSQFLVEGLCAECARPAELSADDVTELFPATEAPAGLKREVGCPACQGKGTQGWTAVCEVLLLGAGNREPIARALVQGTGLAADPASYHPMQHQARRLLGSGALGVGTYRDTIRRNPLLRAQNFIEREQARAGRLGSIFEKFVSPEVKRRLMDGRSLDAVVAGEAREVTCLFCDIRGFTARAESRHPETLFRELNRYFAEVVDAVLQHDGTIDKFIGDAIMVVFGAPLDQPDHAWRALRCALAIRERVDAFNREQAADLPIAVGIGINSGSAAAGCLGTDRRMEYTVLGDTVNVAARLESRAAPGEILISESTYRMGGEAFECMPKGILDLKGKTAGVPAYALISGF